MTFNKGMDNTRPYPHVFLIEDGILCVDYGLHPRITLEALQSAYRQHMALIPHPLPVLIRGKGTMMADPEAEHFSHSQTIRAVTRAVALEISNPLARHSAKLYLRFNKPPYPLQLFDNEAAALAWLRTFVSHSGR